MKSHIYHACLEMLIDAKNERVIYEEEHIDAGNNYGILIGDGDWTYRNGDERLAKYLEEQGIKLNPDEVEDLSWELINDCEPTSGHTFSCIAKGDFEVASFPVGEIEVQFSFSDLVRDWGLPLEVIKEFAKLLTDERGVFSSVYGDCIYLYESSDVFWQFIVDKEWILDRLPEDRANEIRKELEVSV